MSRKWDNHWYGGKSWSKYDADGNEPHTPPPPPRDPRPDGLRELQAFRQKYPMDDKAFDYLQQVNRAVQEVVLKKFDPSHSRSHMPVGSVKDYSPLITSFIKGIANKQWETYDDADSARVTRSRSRSRTAKSTTWRSSSDAEALGWVFGVPDFFRNMANRINVNISDEKLSDLRELLPDVETVPDFPLDNESLENYVTFSVWHRVDEALNDGRKTMAWFGYPEDVKDRPPAVLINSNLIPKTGGEDLRILLMFAFRGHSLECQKVFVSSDLSSGKWMKEYIKEIASAPWLRRSYHDGSPWNYCLVYSDKSPRVPEAVFCKIEERQFNPEAKVNHKGSSADVFNELQALSPEEWKSRVDWAIKRAQTSPSIAVPQVCFPGGKDYHDVVRIQFLLPLSMEPAPSTRAEFALVLDQEQTDEGKTCYSIENVVSLKIALAGALLFNPYGLHWLNPHLTSQE